MANLFEREGYGLWVQLREHIGAPLPKELANPRPVPTHTYADCTRKSACENHRRTYRRELQAQRERQVAEDRAITTYQRNLANQERMAQVAAATRGGTPVVSVDDL